MDPEPVVYEMKRGAAPARNLRVQNDGLCQSVFWNRKGKEPECQILLTLTGVT
jgi:hypothetical protein